MTELPPSLSRFYAEVDRLLVGEIDGAELERRLGPSSSGPEHLDFYRVLLDRNVERVLRDLFPTVYALLERERPGRWSSLVRGYAAAHPPRVRDPNRFGLAMAEYLSAERAADPSLPVAVEELADWHMCRYLAAVATDEADASDGFERRVFVRGYSLPIPALARALVRDPTAPVPPPRPTTVIVYRSVLGARSVRAHTPSLAELGALARRQGLAPPLALASLDEAALAKALARLVELGIVPAGP